MYPGENLLEQSREPKDPIHIERNRTGQHRWRASREGFPGVWGNLGTKEKYRWEHESVLGNTGTSINFYKFSLRRDVYSGGLNREQIREKLLEHGNKGKFWKGPRNPHLGRPQCSAPTLLKGNSYISTSARLGTRALPVKIRIITHAVQPKTIISSREAHEQSKLQREANLCINGDATAL